MPIPRQAAPEGAILVLHACGHNPTGVDVSLEQWSGLLAVALRKRFLTLWDVAYQVGTSLPVVVHLPVCGARLLPGDV